jgi:CHAD domain-containing protein
MTPNASKRAVQRPRGQGKLRAGALASLALALKKQWRRYRKRLKRCQNNFSETAVHDSRVETRRLLSLLELLGDFLPPARLKKIRRALKEHLDTFDELRDAQVQLRAVNQLQPAFPAARPFAVWLRERETHFTRKTRRRIKTVESRRLAKSLAACREKLAAQAKACSETAANARLLGSANLAFRHTCWLRARINPRDTATIHRTRVAFKRFRYMVEALAAHLPGANRRVLKAMHDYQALMGEIQDAEVLFQTLEQFGAERETELKSFRRLRQELLRRRQARIRAYLKASGRALKFWPLPGA